MKIILQFKLQILKPIEFKKKINDDACCKEKTDASFLLALFNMK